MDDRAAPLFEGLALGLKTHVAKLFDVLMASSDHEALLRFERGLERAVVAYEDAISVADRVLDKSD
jgi:hypothetical protein